jgi:hypothetical protein
LDLSAARKPLGGIRPPRVRIPPLARPGSAGAGLWLLQRWQAPRSRRGRARGRLGRPLAASDVRDPTGHDRNEYRHVACSVVRVLEVLYAGEGVSPAFTAPVPWSLPGTSVCSTRPDRADGCLATAQAVPASHVGLDAHPPPPARQARRALCGRYWGSGRDAVGVVSRRGRPRCSPARARSSPTARE